MIDSPGHGFRDHDLQRLRREWVAAYREWTQVAEEKAMTSANLTGQQRAAQRRYRAAETAYFTYLEMRPARTPSK
jgi:hypothetical protein